MLGNESSWRWLAELKEDPASAGVAVIIASDVDDPRKGYALGADLYLPKPVERDMLLGALDRLTRSRILIIDDDPASRYAIRKLCDAGPYHIVEAADARQGLNAANATHPELIVLDLNLPDLRGEEVLRQLSSRETTQGIPVIVATSEDISAEKRQRLGEGGAAAVLAKKDLDRESFSRMLSQFLPSAANAAQP